MFNELKKEVIQAINTYGEVNIILNDDGDQIYATSLNGTNFPPVTNKYPSKIASIKILTNLCDNLGIRFRLS